ncbi:glycogen/starch/alpha-glucan phosphorylase [Desulfatirhabdium butyrativorans]|uniref:glycogen/starch/alpha-glucan phosphorylase n=1 Tax=Desulfatirhabdium butyrativorans TaxID=340467 RepID=UPI0004139EF0|nr:glycogen/starch/alpha-glucan phosphorylase [Desulfatirhabdium butyrativorans]
MKGCTGTKALKNDTDSLRRAICRHIRYDQAKRLEDASIRDAFMALTHSVRDRLIEGMIATQNRYEKANAKKVYYLSMEFLIGRLLESDMINLGIYESCSRALSAIGMKMADVIQQGPDAALGNGGLGRLAACFLDSMATLGIPGFGYGIFYEYGLFKQDIENGYQKEKPDRWISDAGPLAVERPEEACIIPLYGRIEHGQDLFGNYNPMWLDWKVIVGVPHDIPVAGFGGHTVNYLRLYAAKSSSEFDIQIFNTGDYFKAVEQKIGSENISKILYPSDTIETGRELRLIQEYFLVACSLRDIIHKYQKQYPTLEHFHEHVQIQMNDTHPSLAVAELMRILVDEQAMEWKRAWEITQATLAYTNHTLLAEALEKWPVSIFDHVLPRHMQIIYEINHRFLADVSIRWPADDDRLRRMSLIEEGPEKQVRMAHLAMIGSHSTNGVSALHTELLKVSVASDFHDLFPERFNNKTNGITQRRWLLKANPLLAGLITQTIGDQWITQLDLLRRLEAHAADPEFQERFAEVKYKNKLRLQQIIYDATRIAVDPSSIFDIQAKRIHEYKRQMLNVMHIIHQYLSMVEDGRAPKHPKTYIFAGKAAPGYWAAKQIIKLIHNVADIVNQDPRVDDMIKVVFIPDYRVSLAETIIPAADISEQISTAGKEASGTGNMKFALNGAVTIGTLDGANIELQEEIGSDNMYVFGLTADQIQDQLCKKSYNPVDLYMGNDSIRRVLDALWGNRFAPKEPGLFQWIYYHILEKGDEYRHLADFPSYIQAQEAILNDYSDPLRWREKAILNVARIGKFSSDRTILEYARDIWWIDPVLETGGKAE